jgi:hypothetical protein
MDSSFFYPPITTSTNFSPSIRPHQTRHCGFLKRQRGFKKRKSAEKTKVFEIVHRIFLWKTAFFLWKTCGENGENKLGSVEKKPVMSGVVEKAVSFPQVFHRAKTAKTNFCPRLSSVIHSFHSPYYYYI